MPSLKTLYLDYNAFTGVLPHAAGMTNLTELGIIGTNFVGTIPNDWGKLSRLELLAIGSNNGIGGTFPSSLCQMANLRSFEISDTSIVGTIPECIGNMTSLGKCDCGRYG